MTSSYQIKQIKCAVAFLSGGIGLLMMSLSHLAADLTGGPPGPVGKALQLHSGIGPYSGKQTLGVVAWLISWYLLNKILENKDIDPNKIMHWTYGLYALATLLIFPPFLALL